MQASAPEVERQGAGEVVAEPKWAMPDTYLILLCVALVAFALNFLIPAGTYETIVQTVNGVERKVIDPATYQQATDAPQGMAVFAEGGDIGLLNFAFEGMVSGSKWGASIGVFAFILLTGGAFGLIFASGSVERGLFQVIARNREAGHLYLAILCVLFSLGGAVFGMGEEVIPFTLIVVPLLVTMGYDSITALLVTYVATQVGFATSWMNPFGVSIAQGIADVPLMSGSGPRMAIWFVATCLLAGYTLFYARRIQRDPESSLAHDSDAVFRQKQQSVESLQTMVRGDGWILLLFAAGIAWMIWGVVERSYFLPEIASQFFTMGIVIAIVAIAFGLNGLTANKAAAAFKEGAQQLLPAAMVVALAKGIVLLLGGDDPNGASVLNTLLHWAGQGLADVSGAVSAWFMLVFQTVFNFFITSGSGQAALTMPIMAPLADVVGVTRQTAVLAFQLGDGFTNIIVPTSAALMGCLGAARLDWGIWLRFVLPLWTGLFLFASLSVLVAALAGF
ncbi:MULTISPECIES: putative basic amino acid antiporter YfcC [Microbulbifer]|uniref:putative basic amino acid antiporter YfcC n=1 Tax=Microbulbifer TaxID=48073 RepID=UPI001E3132FC|nr:MULTISPECIES: putative basic amino acid antiporter YfcC [Microbulbifer]UHQ55267.1 putative basic amino acid antiporter YfcC [Microbulbifer sp. YPW16]